MFATGHRWGICLIVVIVGSLGWKAFGQNTATKSASHSSPVAKTASRPTDPARVVIPAKLPDHPRLLVTKAALEGIRDRAKTTRWGGAYYDRVRRSAQSWLSRDVVLPERGAQWPHHYACKVDGAHLKQESPTRHVCPLCKKVYSGWPYDDVALGSVHTHLAEGVLHCGLMFQMSGEQRFADKAREILLAYADKYRKYPLHDKQGNKAVGGGHITAQTLDEAMWLFPLVQGADMVWSSLSPAERKTIEDGLMRPAAEAIRAHRMKIHNIQCFKNSAVGLIGLLLNDRELIEDAIQHPEHGYLAQMARGVSPDGVWYEGSWSYHFFTILGLWPLTEAARNCGIDLYGEAFHSMFRAPLAMAMPHGALPAFNDASEVQLKGQNLLEIALTRYHETGSAAFLASQSRENLLALVLGTKELPETSDSALSSKNLPRSGYAILRSGPDEQATWLALKYGPHGGGHGHPDKLNFVLSSRGQVVAPDPGAISYSVPLHQEWHRTTLAHNTLIVNQTSQSPTEGESLAFLSKSAFTAVLADAGSIAPGTRFRRAVAMFGPDLVLFLDHVRCDAPRTLEIAYHNLGSFVQDPVGPNWTLPDRPGYKHFRNPRIVATEGQYSSVLQLKSGLQSRFTSLVPAQARIIAGTGLLKTTADRVPMVLVHANGKELLLGWAITLAEGQPIEPKLRIDTSVGYPVLMAEVGERTASLAIAPDRPGIRFAGRSYATKLLIAEAREGSTDIAAAP